MRVKKMFDHIIECGGTRESTGLSWFELAEKFKLNEQTKDGSKRAKQVKDRWQSYQKSKEYKEKAGAAIKKGKAGSRQGKHEFSEEKTRL